MSEQSLPVEVIAGERLRGFRPDVAVVDVPLREGDPDAQLGLQTVFNRAFEDGPFGSIKTIVGTILTTSVLWFFWAMFRSGSYAFFVCLRVSSWLKLFAGRKY